MRILFCNKYNYAFSGTEIYLFEAMELLRSQGHETALFSMADPRGRPTPYDRHFMPHTDFKEQAGWLQKLRLAGQAIYSWESRRRIRAMIDDFQPDIAHVRNIYHHLSPSILWELKARKVPVVYHLNDFKVLCPTYNFVAHGKACEACKGGQFWHALEKNCYTGRSGSAALIAEAYVHKWLGTYRRCVDCFLAPSQFVRDKFVEHGWDAEKFEILPHFQPIKAVAERDTEGAPLLYFGRLSAEKGVADLLRAMQRLPALRLEIAGDGPERGRLEKLAIELGLGNVKFRGHVRGAELERALEQSRFTILPSHAYETLGKTILESFARARAVVATDLGSRRELVRDGKTGVLYRAGDVDQLVAAIEFLVSRPELADRMGETGRQEMQYKHKPQDHYETLIGLYERLVGRKGHFSVESNHRGAKNPAAGSTSAAAHRRPVLRVAFIGGRGVVSKYSGIETYYEEMGTRLADMGHQVTAYCRTYFTPPRETHKGMHVIRLPTIRSKHLETLIHTFLSTLHVLVRPCDIVHYHALGPALFSLLPRLAGKKTVVTVQGLDWKRKKWGHIASAVLRLGERAAVILPNRTVVVSQELQKYYGANYRRSTFYVPNGGILRGRSTPDKILEWGLKPAEYVLFLGRFSPEKGCLLLIEAYERINTHIKLVLAGASGHCDDYSHQVQAHASERIRVLDSVSGRDLDELLTNAMIFVLPSDMEGLSLALLDAMGAGLCVLGSDIAENREAIDGAGFTFQRGEVADLADRLRFLIANPAVREAAGQAAERRIREHYQWAHIAAEMERVYLDTMGIERSEAAATKPVGRAKMQAPSTKQKAG